MDEVQNPTIQSIMHHSQNLFQSTLTDTISHSLQVVGYTRIFVEHQIKA
jgi:hypothetical protein